MPGRVGCDETHGRAVESPTVGRGFHSGCADLHPARKLVVYPGSQPLHVTPEIDALPLYALARELAE